MNIRMYFLLINTNPDIIPGACSGFSGNLIWRTASEVGNLTEIHSQIPYYPYLSPYGGSGVYN